MQDSGFSAFHHSLGRGHYWLAGLRSNNLLEALVRLAYHSLSTSDTRLY